MTNAARTATSGETGVALGVGYAGMDIDPLQDAPPEPGPASGRARLVAAHVGEYLRALTDFGFQQWLTPRMAPVLYALGVLGSLYFVAMFVIEGFSRSAAVGFGRLLFIGPVAFLVLVTLTRIALEICLVLFRIAVHLNAMAGHTEEIAGGMPRITFWKSWWRKG